MLVKPPLTRLLNPSCSGPFPSKSAVKNGTVTSFFTVTSSIST